MKELSADHGALLTDLYQLTMLQGYYYADMNEEAVFEFFVRRLPENRNFLLCAGLEQALDFLLNLQFQQAQLQWLEDSGFFTREFVQWLGQLRFTGSVDAVAEGRAVFTDEPLLRVQTPLPQAQLIESRLINILQFQTMVASKAARCVLAAPNKLLIDFGMRRAHGGEAAAWAARAAYIAGFSGTSTVSAGACWNIPVFGTMAHSFIQAHDSEIQAFRNFARVHPQNVVLLIDTYDTATGAQRVVELAPELKAQGIAIKAVRVDSGDLASEARKVRRILDAGGLEETGIFCSNSLDEYALQELLGQDAPIDGFGIGTRLTTCNDAPYLDCAYKMQVYKQIPRRKRSSGKTTWPGAKQIYRRYADNGQLSEDLLTLNSDTGHAGEALLQPQIRHGHRVSQAESLKTIRQRCTAELQSLPPQLKRLEPHHSYGVRISEALKELARETDLRQAAAEL